jgi:hypothetical protein
MAHTSEVFPLIDRLTNRAAEAALGRSRIVNPALRSHLRSLLSRTPGEPDALLADPVFEAAFGYRTDGVTMSDLVQRGMLAEPTALALAETTPLDPEERDERNTMPLDRAPYTHQLAAWTALAARPPRSVLVSSGTGSGKTEAFLVPILDALARESAQKGRIGGVRALLLYPLNALIASQRDRLADWTAPFGGDIRFCLYNGQTEEELPAAQRRRLPYEVRDRATLRADPPPLLVTNATMLEYMLVRPQDAPILAASRGRLRWVVLDEAHSYIGSQAAEMTLLLRRTLQAFGVRADEVSFIATSATLGDGDDVRARLHAFLTDLSGAPPERIDVIVGERGVPPLALGQGGLAADPLARGLRARLAAGPAALSTLAGEFDGAALRTLLDRVVQQSDPRDAGFLPLRLHLFHRAQGGMFACVNPGCTGRAGTALDDAVWPFGMVYARDREHCAAAGCGARVLPILLCDDCGSPLLEAAVDATRTRLVRWTEEPPIDEFDPDDDEEGEPQGPHATTLRRLVRPDDGRIHPAAAPERLAMEPATGSLRDRPSPDTLALAAFADHTCPYCGSDSDRRHLFRHLRLGGAFSMTTAGNVLLEAARPSDTNRRLPFDGRQLITFADSRQGTARFAASWQHDAERTFARARILHRLHEASGNDAGDLDAQIAEYERLPPTLLTGAIAAGLLRLRQQRAQLAGFQPLPWAEMRAKLAGLIEPESELTRLWRERGEAFDQPDRLAELQLYTEFLRRPLRANSLETLGLACLRFPAIETLTASAVPDLFLSRNACLDDWKDYLHVLATFYMRANSAVQIDAAIARWTGQRVRARTFLHRRVARDTESWESRWPFLSGPPGRLSRPVLLLRDGLGLDLDDPMIREEVNETLDAAWERLQRISASGLPDGGLRLDLTRSTLVGLEEAFLCPVTYRLLDRGFRGITPYVTQQPQPRERLALTRLSMPRLPHPWCRHPDGRDAMAEVRAWLDDDVSVADLRRRGLWTDIGDRLALLAPFARIVEHSAQQPPQRLRRFEQAFKAGRINVLNCSTTMEMGVDIGGIGTVAMSNVPPSPANYRQRVGRAGRRQEPLAVAFTYCPDSPVGWHAFDHPLGILEAAIDPPRVALDSRVLAQRHVNAMLLGRFLRSQRLDALRLESGPFFAPRLAEQSPARRFVAWLEREAGADAVLAGEVEALLAGTALAAGVGTLEAATLAMRDFDVIWRDERALLQADLDGADGAARRAIEIQVKRMDGEYLLGELARAAFLPGHGFPTDVVPFITPRSRADAPDREETPRARRYPTRTLDIALGEYAPGNELVIDGVVYRSGGVSLNWKRPADVEAAAEIQAMRWLWRCRNCGAAGDSAREPGLCPGCGSTDLRSERALRAAGFVADPDAPPGNAIDYVAQAPAVEPFIAAATPWVSLSNPAIGRFRHDPDGLVITASHGAFMCGYALCLSCGRAEPETAAGGGSPLLPSGMVAHRPLRRQRDRKLRCEGTDKPFAIRRNLALGHSRQTDVFELQFSTIPSEEVAITLAIALREALCRRLGIAREEVACLADRSPGPAARSGSIWLFDSASGGAGYAGTASSDIYGLLQGAQAALKCTNPGCTRACPACLVLRDTARLANRLDRGAAMDFLVAIVPQLYLPPSEMVFGPKAKQWMEQAPLPAAIRHELTADPSSDLVLLLHGTEDEWDAERWWALPLLDQAARDGREVVVLAPATTLNGISFSAALALRGLADRAGRRLRVAALTAPPVPAGLLAVVGGTDTGIAWAATGDLAPDLPESVVRGRLAVPLRIGPPFDAYARAEAIRPDAYRCRIGAALNGPVEHFGVRFWETLAVEGAGAELRGCGPLCAISYTDRYLFSPLPLRLLHAVLVALRRRAGVATAARVPLTLHTLSGRRGADPALPHFIEHDWRDMAMRDAVAARLMTQAGFDPTLKSDQRANIPHARTLRIEGTDGAIEIQLDQGFGFWRVHERLPFNFAARLEEQARRLLELRFSIATEVHGSTDILIMAAR